MNRTIKLNGLGEEPTIVELFGKQYRLRPVTRSVQKGLEEMEGKLRNLDDDASGDDVVAVLAAGIEVLLAIEGAHRTHAEKLILDKWNADQLSVEQLRSYFEALEESAANRPT